ncbi:hypothetical protein GCM10009784_01370 [Arthrobacter parietis]|uniref:Uncharacterized protein n=1 Tax=Arthrobacter parietis TaxID=271434 RepID=A0ABP5MC42_9MICC
MDNVDPGVRHLPGDQLSEGAGVVVGIHAARPRHDVTHLPAQGCEELCEVPRRFLRCDVLDISAPALCFCGHNTCAPAHPVGLGTADIETDDVGSWVFVLVLWHEHKVTHRR